jgi:hypothetical protein
MYMSFQVRRYGKKYLAKANKREVVGLLQILIQYSLGREYFIALTASFIIERRYRAMVDGTKRESE